MGFGKAFGLGLVIFVALNLVWTIIVELLVLGSLTVFSNFTTVGGIFGTLFGSVSISPFSAILQVMLGSLLNTMVVMGGGSSLGVSYTLLGALFYIVPALVTAILVGRFAKKGGAFFAMLLIMMIGGILLTISTMMFGATAETGIFTIFLEMLDPTGSTGILAAMSLLLVPIAALVNGVFYGGIAALTSKSEGY